MTPSYTISHLIKEDGNSSWPVVYLNLFLDGIQLAETQPLRVMWAEDGKRNQAREAVYELVLSTVERTAWGSSGFAAD